MTGPEGTPPSLPPVKRYRIVSVQGHIVLLHTEAGGESLNTVPKLELPLPRVFVPYRLPSGPMVTPAIGSAPSLAPCRKMLGKLYSGCMIHVEPVCTSLKTMP